MAYYGSSIHKAAEDGDVHGLRRELAKGVSPNKGVLPNADIHSQGPLHVCAPEATTRKIESSA